MVTVENTIDLLVRLQEADDEISKIDDLLEKIPAELGGLSASLDAAKEESKRYHEKLEEDNKLRLAKEREVEDKTAGIGKAKSKLNDVKTNQEYKAVLHEIDNMEKAISTLEDEQLALMEQLDEDRAKEEDFVKKLEIEEANFKKLKVEKEAEIEQIKGEREKAVAVKNEMASQLEPDMLAEYDKTLLMRDRKAVVELKDGYCSACHQSVMPQMALEIRTCAAVHSCQFCGRFLYIAKEEKTEENNNKGEGGQTAAGSHSGPEESPDTLEQGTP